MKAKVNSYLLLLGLILNALLLVNCTQNDPIEEEFSDYEIESLLYMLEEEKMARDVYTYLDNLYDAKQFSNIKSSEQTHMEYIKGLLEDHEIPYSISDPGKFQNSEIQELYNDLISMGEVDLHSAFTVGATIEDIDLYDLQEFVAATENEEIITILERLICSSKNHMRAFVKGLKDLDSNYTPQYISQAEFDAIIEEGHGGHCH